MENDRHLAELAQLVLSARGMVDQCSADYVEAVTQRDDAQSIADRCRRQYTDALQCRRDAELLLIEAMRRMGISDFVLRDYAAQLCGSDRVWVDKRQVAQVVLA